MNRFSKKLITWSPALALAAFAMLILPAAAQAACTASLNWNTAAVMRGGSATETWTITGADSGTGGANCSDGHGLNSTIASGLGFGPQSYTFNNIQYPITCNVWASSGGVQCSSGDQTVGLTCNASLTWDKTSVPYNGTATETWNVSGLDPAYGDKVVGRCTINGSVSVVDPLGANGSWTTPPLTSDATCQVTGYLNGVQGCTDSAVVSVQAPPAGASTGIVNVVSYGVDQLGGLVNLPIIWTLNGPNGFQDSVNTPVNKKTYQNAGGGSYTIVPPPEYVEPTSGIRYVLKSIAPCGDVITNSCTQTLTIPPPGQPPVVQMPAPEPPVPQPVFQPLRLGGDPAKEVQLPLRTPGFRPLAFLNGWWKALFPGTPAAMAQSGQTPQISFTFYYGPKAPTRDCSKIPCPPTLPASKTPIGSLDVNPTSLEQGTPHTVSATGGVPNAPAALYKTIWEWDNYVPGTGGRTRVVGPIGSGGATAPRTTTPFQESAVPWAQMSGVGSFGPISRTANCSDDGSGAPVKGFRIEVAFLDYDYANNDGYSSPAVIVSRDCRGTVEVHSDIYSPLSIPWTISGPSNWSPNPATPDPVTNQNVNNYNGLAFQQFSKSGDLLTISFGATDGAYTLSNLPPNCTVDKASQPVFPAQTTTFNITCNGAPGSGLACSASPSPAQTGQPVQFTAIGGTGGSYAWSFPGGDPTSGSGSPISVTYATGNQYTATLTSAGSGTAICKVNVCPGAPTLTIAPPTNSTAVGGTAQYQGWYDADGPNCSSASTNITEDKGAQWDIADATIAQNQGAGAYLGLKSGSTDVSVAYKGLSASAALTVFSTTADFDCSVNPAVFSVNQGASQTGSISCKPLNGFTGKINLAPVTASLPQGSTMTITPASVNVPPNPTTANYTFTAGTNTPPGAKTFQVTGTSPKANNNAGQDLSHSMNVTPTIIAPQPALSVALAVNPTSGYEPLPVTLTATIGQHTTGPYTYYFWWDCPNAATTVAATEAQGCSAPNFTSQPTGNTTLQTNHTYNRGSYSPKVVVEQGGLSAAAGGGTGATTITVNPPQQHSECVSSACVQVDNSPGNTADRCSKDADCGGGGGCVDPANCPGGGGGDFHGECDATQKACINKAGGGASTCSSDPKCGNPHGESHLVCENNACVIVGGAGSNDTGCAAVGQTCLGTPPTGACTIVANPKVIKYGGNSTVTWSCATGIRNCSLSGPGILSQGSGTATVKPSQTSQYTLSCNRGTYSVPVTVYVVQSFKEVPPGSQ